jgi:LysM repeat protein
MLGKAVWLAKAGLKVLVILFVFLMVMSLLASVPAEERPPITPGPRPTVSPSNGKTSEDKVRGSIRGTVYEDQNGDGKCANTGEPGLPGVTLELINGGNSISVISGDDGTYAPVAMGLGTWTVTVKPPSGWHVTSAHERPASLSSDQLLALGVDFCLAKDAAALPPAPPAPLPPAGSYVVQPGDNLFRIGLRFGFTVNELAAYNNIANPNLIYPGQVILFPPG